MKLVLILLVASLNAYSGPVCGSDGHNYSSEQECHAKNVTVLHVGLCMKKAIDKVWMKNTDNHGNWNNHKFIPWAGNLDRHSTGVNRAKDHKEKHYKGEVPYIWNYDLVAEPVLDDTFTTGGQTYTYDASKWRFGNFDWHKHATLGSPNCCCSGCAQTCNTCP